MTIRFEATAEDTVFFIGLLARTDPVLRRRVLTRWGLSTAIMAAAVALLFWTVGTNVLTVAYTVFAVLYLAALPLLRRWTIRRSATHGPNRDNIGPHAVTVDGEGVTDEVRGRREFVPWGEVTGFDLVGERGLIRYGTWRGIILREGGEGDFHAFWTEAQALWKAAKGTPSPPTPLPRGGRWEAT